MTKEVYMTAISLQKETNSYWNLIKDAENEVKLALIRRLTEALAPAVKSSRNSSQSITPALRRRINKARKEYKQGETTTCTNPQEMQQFFDSL